MARKFKEGDLVVLKKSVLVEPYPPSFDGLTPEGSRIRDVIASRTSIRHFVRHSVQAAPDCLLRGTIGIVKGFQNVFMLDRTHVYYLSLIDGYPDDQVIRVVSPASDRVSAIVNRPNCMHMLVLIDGRLVAFMHSSFFELQDDARSRSPSITVRYSVSQRLENLKPDELEKRVASGLRKLQRAFGEACVVSVLDTGAPSARTTIVPGQEEQDA